VNHKIADYVDSTFLGQCHYRLHHLLLVLIIIKFESSYIDYVPVKTTKDAYATIIL
jgi:hypothetical protein